MLMLRGKQTDQSRRKQARRDEGGKAKERVLPPGVEPGHAPSELGFL